VTNSDQQNPRSFTLYCFWRPPNKYTHSCGAKGPARQGRQEVKKQRHTGSSQEAPRTPPGGFLGASCRPPGGLPPGGLLQASWGPPGDLQGASRGFPGPSGDNSTCSLQPWIIPIARCCASYSARGPEEAPYVTQQCFRSGNRLLLTIGGWSPTTGGWSPTTGGWSPTTGGTTRGRDAAKGLHAARRRQGTTLAEKE